jgi:hypothetical protein
VQRKALLFLGVEPDKIYVDHGLTGTSTNRPGLCEELAASRAGDTFIVTKLDRLARSVRDFYQIAEDLAAREVTLSIGGSVYDPPIRWVASVQRPRHGGRFEGDLIRLRTKEEIKITTVFRALDRARVNKATAAAKKTKPDT